jgi:hypothetical protein
LTAADGLIPSTWVSILDHVGGIDADLEPAVHAQPDHALEAVPVALDQDSQGAVVTLAGGVHQLLIRSGVGAHGEVHIPFRGSAGRAFTVLERIIA